MVKRRSRFGEFLGCSGYPDCDGIKRLQSDPVKTGVACPECKEGEILERRSRRGKIFFGCGRYPKCKFAAWNKVVPAAVPVVRRELHGRERLEAHRHHLAMRQQGMRLQGSRASRAQSRAGIPVDAARVTSSRRFARCWTPADPSVETCRALLRVVACRADRGICDAGSCAANPVDVIPHQEETVAALCCARLLRHEGERRQRRLLRDSERRQARLRAEGQGQGREIFHRHDVQGRSRRRRWSRWGWTSPATGSPTWSSRNGCGGANCCLLFHIFEIGPTFKKLGTIDAEFGDSGPHFVHPDKDSKSTGVGDSRFMTGPLPTGTPTSPIRPRPKSSCATATMHTVLRPT